MATKVIGLGLESSCDETSASIVIDGVEICSNVISSQIDLHSEYFGVVPEIASRAHLELINGVIQEALDVAGVSFSDLSYVAVTNRPGLVGALMISLQSAKVISYSLGIPLITVSHIEAHLYAPFLMDNKPSYPCMGLLVSGGNTALYLIEGVGRLSLVGRTTDDAVGEAFDKVSKYLGLGYPGGPAIDKLAAKAVVRKEIFPKNILTRRDPFQFSYSGLKTAVITYIKNNPDTPREEVVWAFQESAVSILLKRLVPAAEEFGTSNIIVAGGVAANSRLRSRLSELEDRFSVFIPSQVLCTDNAAMVAGLGYHYFMRGEFAGLDAEVHPRDLELRVKRDAV